MLIRGPIRDPEDRRGLSDSTEFLFTFEVILAVMLPILLRPCRTIVGHRVSLRAHLASSLVLRSSSSAAATPWFVDPEFVGRPRPPHIPGPSMGVKPLPLGLPALLVTLYGELSKSPLLEPGALEIRTPPPSAPGPPLPKTAPKGRRRRGGTDFGEGVPMPEGGLWKWVVIAQVRQSFLFERCFNSCCCQVKDGTEGRGAIESVLRTVRKTVSFMARTCCRLH